MEGANRTALRGESRRVRQQLEIVFPLEGFNKSGGVRIVTAIASSLAENGHRVRLLVPDYAARPAFPVGPDVIVERIATLGIRGIRKVYYALFLCIHGTRSADVCFATGYKTAYYLWLSRLLNMSRGRLVYVIQGYEPLSHAWYSKRNRISRYALYIVAMASYWLPLQQVAVSGWLRNKVGRKAVRVIPNGVDLDMFRPSPVIGEERSKFTIGTIGSDATAKGYRVFVDSITHVHESLISAARVVVACDEEVALPERIQAELIVPQNDLDLVAFYQRCDVFVFSSLVEGFGLPPIEAMACGVPVVVADCGGVREFVNEQNAIIVPVGNAAAIAAAVTLLFHDVNRRRELRSLGVATAKAFSSRAMLAAYRDLVEAP